MTFTMRSLGGKFIVVATFMLLLCMLLFALLSWGSLKFYSEHEAKSAAQVHLSLIKRAYQVQSDILHDELYKISADTNITNTIATQPITQATRDHLQSLLVPQFTQKHLSMLSLVSRDHHLLAQLTAMDTTTLPSVLPFASLAAQGQGQTVTALQSSTAGSILNGTGQLWSLAMALPLHNAHGAFLGVLMGSQAIDDTFAQALAQETSTGLLLCIDGQVQGIANLPAQNRTIVQNSSKLCTVGASSTFSGTQRYLTQAATITLDHQSIQTPSLVLVAVEPLYVITVDNMRLLLIIGGIGLFIFGFGVIAYTFVTRLVFVRPLHRLQTHVQSLVADTAGQVVPQSDNELETLTQSYSLLADCLESESQAMTEHLGNLLIMSDAFISTLNLEQLLGEIVLRLGNIMKAKHVSLLLYGREMLSPWAVAQWSETAGKVVDSYSAPTLSFIHSLQQYGEVTVHADPDGDITLVTTSKMAAAPKASSKQTGGKRKGTAKEGTQPYGLRRPRIPRLALRDLDMNLAHIVIQRHKIAYGEDIAAIYQERGENWAKMALEAGYQSTIAVPLLLHDQTIGACILYRDTPYQVSSRDTFLLSTAAVQASVAIQNALLFVEVKEKNADLERASHLKSQFLANVTHELRTPLHSIISYGSLIVDGFVDGELTTEQEEHIQFMVNRAEDLSHLVDDMLDLSKIEADHIEVKTEPIELRTYLMEVVNQLKPLANNKKLYVHLEVDETLPLIQADSHRLRQVVINLISNALKFTEKGGVTIRCMLIHNNKMAHISVHDTGIGISPAALGYIFEAFRQADGSTTRRFGGTGLGLTIARKLIELQGGEVAVESVPGRGSTFSFTLPVATASIADT